MAMRRKCLGVSTAVILDCLVVMKPKRSPLRGAPKPRGRCWQRRCFRHLLYLQIGWFRCREDYITTPPTTDDSKWCALTLAQASISKPCYSPDGRRARQTLSASSSQKHRTKASLGSRGDVRYLSTSVSRPRQMPYTQGEK